MQRCQRNRRRRPQASPHKDVAHRRRQSFAVPQIALAPGACLTCLPLTTRHGTLVRWRARNTQFQRTPCSPSPRDLAAGRTASRHSPAASSRTCGTCESASAPSPRPRPELPSPSCSTCAGRSRLPIAQFPVRPPRECCRPLGPAAAQGGPRCCPEGALVALNRCRVCLLRS